MGGRGFDPSWLSLVKRDIDFSRRKYELGHRTVGDGRERN